MPEQERCFSMDKYSADSSSKFKITPVVQWFSIRSEIGNLHSFSLQSCIKHLKTVLTDRQLGAQQQE